MNLSFIKLDINILDDSKIKLIRKYPDGDKLIVLWLGLLCMAMKSDTPGYIYVTNGIPYTTKDLSIILDIEEKTVQMGIELFQTYKMIDIIKGGVIEIINFNRHQKLDKIETARQLSRESSRKYREKQKLLLGDADVTESDVTEKEIDKDIDKEEEIEEIYKLYPAKCPVKGTSTNKCSRNKKQIEKLLKAGNDKLIFIVKKYIKDCTENKVWIKNFTTFLNNLPDYEEEPETTTGLCEAEKEFFESQRKQKENE